MRSDIPWANWEWIEQGVPGFLHFRKSYWRTRKKMVIVKTAFMVWLLQVFLDTLVLERENGVLYLHWKINQSKMLSLMSQEWLHEFNRNICQGRKNHVNGARNHWYASKNRQLWDESPGYEKVIVIRQVSRAANHSNK